ARLLVVHRLRALLALHPRAEHEVRVGDVAEELPHRADLGGRLVAVVGLGDLLGGGDHPTEELVLQLADGGDRIGVVHLVVLRRERGRHAGGGEEGNDLRHRGLPGVVKSRGRPGRPTMAILPIYPPTRLTVKPRLPSSVTSRSRWSPWISTRPSLTIPPEPQRFLSAVASSARGRPESPRPVVTGTPAPLRPLVSRARRTSRAPR